MEEDGDAGWATGPLGEDTDTVEMDTKEAAIVVKDPTRGPQGIKQKPGPRGKRTSAQKKRKSAKLKRALAISDRVETKVGNRESTSKNKKALKSLWHSGAKRR